MRGTKHLIFAIIALVVTALCAWRCDWPPFGHDDGLHGDGFIVFVATYVLLMVCWERIEAIRSKRK